MKPRLLGLVLISALVVVPQLLARGKNKISYEDFDWQIYQSQHYKVFFYPDMQHLLEGVVDKAEAAYKRVSEKLQHELDFSVPLVIFKTHEEFMQNNVVPGFLPQGVEAFADPYQSRMVLPIDLPPKELYALIAHELTHIFQYDMLYNNRISTIIRANTPTWFQEGMASWVADDEDNLARMVLRDVSVNSGMTSLGAFGGLSYIAYRVGHAAFDFMEERYGIEGVRNFLWQYRKNITGNVSSAIERAFEIEASEFDRDFRKYLRKRYIELLPVKEEPDDHAVEIRTRKTITTLSPELSPSGDLFAAIIPVRNELDLVLISTKDGRVFRNLTKGHTNRYTSLNVGAFQGVNDISWSSDGNAVAFTGQKEGTNRVFVSSVLNGKIKQDLFFPDIRDAQSPIFGKDGNNIYFVGNREGVYDIFGYDLTTKTLTNMTEDEFHDRNPRLSPDGKEILYSSMRDGFYKIFDLNLESKEQTQLTSGLGNDIQASYSTDMQSIYFSSDRFDDIYNIYELELETGVKKQYTNILTGAFSPQERMFFDHKEGEERKQLVFTAYYQGRYRVYRMEKPENREEFYDVASDNYANVKDYDMSANVKLDDRRYRKFKLKGNFSINGAQVSAGTTTSGQFLSNTSVSFADTVGNRVLDVFAYTVSSYETYRVSYLDRSRRWQWGGYLTAQQSYIVQNRTSNPLAERGERAYKNNEIAGLISYPFTLNSRFDVFAGMTDQDRWTLSEIPSNELVDGRLERTLSFTPLDYTEPFVSMNYSWDSAMYKQYGPQHGTLLDLGVRHDLGQNTSLNLDFRTYREITARSLFAVRVIGNYSEGDDVFVDHDQNPDTPDIFAGTTSNYYFLGGNDLLRGDYYYQEFVGSRRILTQLELRFPIIDQLVLAGGVGFRDIRASMFVDVGGAWFDDDNFNFEFQESLPDELEALRIPPNGGDLLPHESVDPRDEFYNPENPNNDYLLGAYGIQLSMNLLGFNAHWTWSSRTNFDDFPSNSRMSFWIGYQF